MSVASPAGFSITYDAPRQLLVGRWLLDMRCRRWHTAAFASWFAGFLASAVVRELGSPVFIAYVAAEAHRPDIESAATQATLRQSAQVEFYPFFFHDEAAACEWLAYYRSHPDTRPALPPA